MTLVVLGIDALDPELVSPSKHPNLILESHKSIETINSSAGEPSTHELWPTIITGLKPEEHGLILEDGVSWESPFLRFGSNFADYLLPDILQKKLGAWILNNTSTDAFRTPKEYYSENNITTIFDSVKSKPIGIPNYVLDQDSKDREHQLRSSLSKLFERDPNAKGGHKSSDPNNFYELCMEMSMIRIARVRRALRSNNYELVFGYTSGLDLIGHVSYDDTELQMQAYNELDDFVSELIGDLNEDDELVIISDHGLQDGKHTHEAFVSSTATNLIERITSVTDFRNAISVELEDKNHLPEKNSKSKNRSDQTANEVRQQLEDLGYM